MKDENTSVQKELIALAEHKYQEALNKPETGQDELRYLELMTEFFKDADKICEAPRTITTAALVYYGYKYRQSCEIYDKLMEEVNKKYVLIHPDSLKEE